MQFSQMINRELVIRCLAREASKAERLLLENWIKEDAENKRYFDEIEFLWRASAAGREISESNKAEDWNSILGKIGESVNSPQETTKRKPVKSRLLLKSFLKVAAIFFLAFSLSWLTFSFVELKPEKGSLAYNQIITAKGQKSQIILSDGTKVWLNSETSLKYPTAFNKRNREVYLEGEAFFEVQKKVKKTPFLVKTTDMDIEVLGTRFNVMAYADEETVEATLEKGVINIVRRGSISANNQQVLLKPNQKITLVKKGSQAILSELENSKPTLVKRGEGTSTTLPSESEQVMIFSKIDVGLHTAWKDDRLIFQSETLENIVYKLERWYDVKIHIQDEELKTYTYTGEFAHKETLSQVMEIFNLTTPINYVFDENDLYIERVTD